MPCETSSIHIIKLDDIVLRGLPILFVLTWGKDGYEEQSRQEMTDRIGRASSEHCDMPKVYYSKLLYILIQKGKKAKSSLP